MYVRTALAAVAALIATTASASADVRATPDALVFGAQGISTISAARDVTVMHTPRRRISVTIAGANPTDFFLVRNGCEGDASYTTGACSNLSVRFAPSAAGPRSAILRLTGDGTQDVPLLGTGTAPAAQRIASVVSARFRTTRRFTRVRSLQVRRVPSTATVTLRCSGRGCPFARRTLTARNGRANAPAAMRRAKLRPGAMLEVRVTAAGTIGQVVRYRVRSRRPPVRSTLCTAAGGTTPKSC